MRTGTAENGPKNTMKGITKSILNIALIFVIGCLNFSDPSAQEGFSSSIITNLHRYEKGKMFGGWGPHLGHLLRSSDNSLWFADDTGNDVNWNPAIAYYKREGDNWFLKGTNNLIGCVQQNTASIMVLDSIYSYGVDIVGKRIVESCYKIDSGAGNSSYLPFFLAPASNYIGAAVSPSGTKIVWWTEVINGRGKFHYIYNRGGGWQGVISSYVSGYNCAAYVTIAFKNDSKFTLQAELIRGQPPNWTYRSAVADGQVGKPTARWTILSAKKPDNTMNPNDIWIDPISKDSHALAYTYNHDTVYYYRRKYGYWTGPLYTFPAVYRARFINSNDGNLYLVFGKSGEGLKIIGVNKKEIAGHPINWRKLPVKSIPMPEGYNNIYAIYPESSVYQSNPVKGINFAVVGSQRENEVLQVGRE